MIPSFYYRCGSKLWIHLATAGPIGRCLPAPGSFGSLIGLLLVLAWPFGERSSAALGLVIALMAVFGIVICGWAERGLSKGRDPGSIVWDEIVGQALTLWLVLRWVDFFGGAEGWAWWGLVVLSFGSFRLFDISKWWVVGWLDRHFHGGLGMMLDDLAAAVLASVLTVFLYAILLYGIGVS